MQATNYPLWLPGWRRHEDLYDAFKHPDEDHSELISDLEEFVRTYQKRGVDPYSILLTPIGGFDATPYPVILRSPGQGAVAFFHTAGPSWPTNSMASAFKSR